MEGDLLIYWKGLKAHVREFVRNCEYVKGTSTIMQPRLGLLTYPKFENALLYRLQLCLLL